jgi:hypothetical protein
VSLSLPVADETNVSKLSNGNEKSAWIAGCINPVSDLRETMAEKQKAQSLDWAFCWSFWLPDLGSNQGPTD